MSEKSLLSGVEDTLYIPLVSRIYVSEHFPKFFYDEGAVSLKSHIPTNEIERNCSEFFFMASVCRQETIDRKILSFLEKHPKSNIVFLGAGLETAYHRINNTTANFYQVDLPRVIELRERLLGCGTNETLIPGDMFSPDWIEKLNPHLPSLILVSGVYQYFEEEKIVDMIKKMKQAIPRGELVFDATNEKGLKIANKYVKKTGNADALMYFSVNQPSKFALLTGTRLVETEGFFARALKDCQGLKPITRIYMYFADRWERTKVIHLAFY